MRFWDFNRHITSASILLAFGQHLGLNAQTLLAGSGLSESDLDVNLHPTGELSAAQELQIVSNLMEHASVNIPLGLLCGKQYGLTSFGLMGESVRFSATLRDAAQMALRLIRLSYAFSLISLHETQDHVVVTFGEPNLTTGMSRFLVERDMVACVNLVSEWSERSGLVRFVSFRFKSNGLDASSFFEGHVPEYGARFNAIAFDKQAFNEPLRTADPIKAKELEQVCASLIDQRKRRIGVAQQVEQYLRVPGLEIPDQPTMARLMYMSERTLKRKLAEEGTTYREISANVRKKLAEEGLRNQKVSISALALRLGYADVSSFSQAFRRWFGVSPQHYRSQQKEI